MVFFNKPAGGPDSVGGVFPWAQVAKCRNRAGATLTKGQVVQLALSAGNHQATEIATNDSNSYIPGASNDTVWNTVVDPDNDAVTAPGSGILTGGIFGVVIEPGGILDNGVGDVQFFGLVEEAFVIDGGSSKDGAVPGQPLTVTTGNNFDCDILSNEILVGFYLDAADATLTNAALKRVFLTNGIGLTVARAATVT